MKKKKPRRGFTGLRDFEKASNEIYLNLLGYKPEQTSLKNLNENDWNNFCFSYGLNKNSKGIYLPRNQTAVIPEDNYLSLFHEYFGHGLYSERSLLGKKLVDLEKKLFNEEKDFFENKKFTKKDLDNFRKENETFNYLQSFKNQNLAIYEGFAVFSEYFLSKNFGLENIFENKYETFNWEFGKYFDDVVSFNKKFGDLACFYGFGMARRTEPIRVKKLLEDVYGDKLNDVKFALLYGSKKEFSDIDVFSVGENPQEAHSDFLDFKMKSQRDFRKGIENFDVRVVVPLMNGEFVLGDNTCFEKSKQQVLSQPITEETIKYNLKWSFRMQRLRDENLQDDFLRNKFEGYSQTYLGNALALKEGRKLFTKEDLLSYSHSERFIELKGGIE